MPIRKSVTLLPNALALCCVLALASPGTVQAQANKQSAQIVAYKIQSGSLDSALNQFSSQSKLQIVYSPELVVGKRSSGLSGQHPPKVALKRLLQGTGLTWDEVNESMYVLKKLPVPDRQSRNPRGAKPEAKVETSSREGQDVPELDKMVVVGSRLGVSPVDSAMPIQVITREQIDRSGSGNIAQVLSYLSEVSINSNGDRPIGAGDGLQDGSSTNSTTVQMRGMPRGTTLILINGRRAGDSAAYSDTGQFDLSGIPLALVERIEVLPAGSSAIYGGDGLAGVINVVLRRDANGTEVRYRHSYAKGYSTSQGTLMWGKTWDGADLTIAATWNKEGALYSSERPLTADQDYSRFGGYDARSTSGYPATVYSLEGCPAAPRTCRLAINLRGNLPGLNSPYAVVPLGSDGIGLTPSDFLTTQGQQNKTSGIRNLRSAEERYGLSMTGRKELGEHLELFAEFNRTEREVPAYQVPLTTISGQSAFGYARIPASNPFNPFGVDVSMGYNFRDTAVFSTYEQQFIRGALGIRGKQKYFDWEISGWESRDKAVTGGAMYFNDAPIIAAVNSTDPATALNPFVTNGGLPVSRDVLESFIQDLNGTTRSKTNGLTAFIRGRPFSLPAGQVVGLMGVELQRQQYEILTNNDAFSTPEFDGATESTAYFAEARFPIVGPREGTTLETLALTGAMRRESSNRYDRPAMTETAGIEFRPASSWLLRSTYSTAFRPLINYFAVSPSRYYEQQIYDPTIDDFYYVNVHTGGGAASELRPEKSRNATVGFVYRPDAGFSISATGWDMKFRDRISYIDPQTVVDQESLRPNRVTRDAESGLVQEVDSRQVNIALISASGIDLGFEKTWLTARGAIQTSIAATYTYKYDQQATPDSEVENRLSVFNSDGWAPRWKIVPRVGWEGDKLRTMITGRYVSKYRDPEPFVSGPKAGESNYLGDFWLLDVNFDLQVGRYFANGSKLSGANLSFGATNVLDRRPDFCVACYSSGYDASQYDIVGRTIYAELRMNF